MTVDLSKLNPHSCPACGSENFEAARFCRACGRPIHPATEVTTKQPSKTPARPDYVRQLMFWPIRNSQPGIERGIKTAFTGLFLLAIDVITLFVQPGSGTAWWFWLMFFVGFYGLSVGVTEIVKESIAERQRQPAERSTPLHALPTQRLDSETSRADTNEIAEPPSIVEGTTKQLKVDKTPDEFEKDR